jgi:hypothetical protein
MILNISIILNNLSQPKKELRKNLLWAIKVRIKITVGKNAQ